MKRIAGLVIAVIAAVMLTTIGAGVGSADSKIQYVNSYGENIGTFGDHASCRGSFHLAASAPKDKRGVVRITVTSFGFVGDGPSWKRNPVCRFKLLTRTTSGSAFFRDMYIPVAFGPRREQKTSQEIVTGSGPVMMGFSVFADQFTLVPKGGATAFYMLVP